MASTFKTDPVLMERQLRSSEKQLSDTGKKKIDEKSLKQVQFDPEELAIAKLESLETAAREEQLRQQLLNLEPGPSEPPKTLVDWGSFNVQFFSEYYNNIKTKKTFHDNFVSVYFDLKSSNPQLSPFEIYKRVYFSISKSSDEDIKNSFYLFENYDDLTSRFSVDYLIKYIFRKFLEIEEVSLVFETNTYSFNFIADSEIQRDKVMFLYLINDLNHIKNVFTMLRSKFQMSAFNHQFKKESKQAFIDDYVKYRFTLYLDHLNSQNNGMERSFVFNDDKKLFIEALFDDKYSISPNNKIEFSPDPDSTIKPKQIAGRLLELLQKID